MKDRRVRWIDSRWGQGLQVFIAFPSAGILSILYGFLVPIYLVPLPTIFGITLSLWFIMTFLFTLVGGLIWCLISWGSSSVNEYLIMKSPYLIPRYKVNGLLKCSFNICNKKEIEWVDNKIWYDELELDVTIQNSELTAFNDLDSDQIYYMKNEYLKDLISQFDNEKLKGYFTVERGNYHHSTCYGIKYLGGRV